MRVYQGVATIPVGIPTTSATTTAEDDPTAMRSFKRTPRRNAGSIHYAE